MNKVVGARIDDSLYHKMLKDGRSHTIIIREALAKYYFNYERKRDVNGCKQHVNNTKNNDEYKMIDHKVNQLLGL
jgi:hypothetical protein